MKKIKTYLKNKSITSDFDKQEIQNLTKLMQSENFETRPALNVFVKDPNGLFDLDDFKNVTRLLGPTPPRFLI